MTKTLGKYEILKTLGQGAMGEVYLAHHPAIGREVAIKTILPSAAKGDDAEGRFRREAEAAGQLNHPNLVTIFDFDKDQDVLYLVMEFVKGDDLEDLIRQDALTQSEFLEVLAQVCDGLSYAHRHGIIHRDIKPSNVRVMRDGKRLLAKVMDFGIARMEDSNMTATGIVMGTVSYMAPEYIREGHASSQSDLFAVGVMLHECLTGRKPFAGDNTTTILFKIVSDPAPPVDPSLIHGISPRIRQVLDRALAKEPGGRFGNADELAKALRACKDPTWSGALEGTVAMVVQQAGLRASDPEGTQVIRAAAPTAQVGPNATSQAGQASPALAGQASPAKGRGGLYAAAGAAALVLAAGGAYLTVRSKGETPPAGSAFAQAAGSAQTAPGAAQPTSGQGAPGLAQPSGSGQAAPGAAQPSGSGQAAPGPAAGSGPGQAAPQAAQPSRAPQAVSNPAPAAPAPQAAPGAKPAPLPAAPAKPLPATPAPRAEPAGPAADPAKQALALMGSDPRQAAALLKPLVQASPTNVEMNANYLAALYHARSPWDFDQALTHAAAAGVTTKVMFKVPAFRGAMIEERNLVKANGRGLLPPEVMEKVVAGL